MSNLIPLAWLIPIGPLVAFFAILLIFKSNKTISWILHGLASFLRWH